MLEIKKGSKFSGLKKISFYNSMREASKAIGSLARTKALGFKRQQMQGLSGSTNMRVYASLLIASMH